MSVAAVIGKIFGLFDKLDDIVYEPVKLLCDAVRVPLNSASAKSAQNLEVQLKQFEVDLDLERKEREMNLSIEERKLNEEINEMILDKQMERNKEMIELEKQYRLEMAEAAGKMANILANVEVEARASILTLYNEQRKKYLEQQEAEKKSTLSTISEIKEMFPNNESEISAIAIEYLKSIMQNSRDFSAMLNRDMEKVFGIIDEQTQVMGKLAEKYFQPAAPDQSAITQNVVTALEEKK